MPEQSLLQTPPRGKGDAPTFTFGYRHKNKLLPEVPTRTIRWALRECRLSSGEKAALCADLTRRGQPRGGAVGGGTGNWDSRCRPEATGQHWEGC
jgi:hypothetical protein